jgi:hypothetical protein
MIYFTYTVSLSSYLRFVALNEVFHPNFLYLFRFSSIDTCPIHPIELPHK